ncbi:hypothetical protein HBB16_04365, partial [Pseudonocardia sp. MCCB 268]|nr:hypothetical protein [Pseudonocardia cytotoxica]
YFVQLRIAKVKQTTTNGIDSTYEGLLHRLSPTWRRGWRESSRSSGLRELVASGQGSRGAWDDLRVDRQQVHIAALYDIRLHPIGRVCGTRRRSPSGSRSGRRD